MTKPNYLEGEISTKLEMLRLMKIAMDQKAFKYLLGNLKKMILLLPHLGEIKNFLTSDYY